ncbi:hypothetical protein ABPG77_008833 [Micractinium sp. CCAP 211/92]
MSKRQGPLLQDALNEATAEAADLSFVGMQAAQKIVGAVKEGAEKAAAVFGAREEEADQPAQEPDRDLGHAEWPPSHVHGHAHSASAGAQNPAHAGALERMREAAHGAVEGVKMRLHLGVTGGPTAEQRTGEALHMAKAAEGRNKVQDDSIDHALHDALKPERGEKPEVSAFPETLGDAFVAAQMKDLPADPPSAAAAASLSADASVEPAPPSPFSSGARAKL